MKPNFARVCAVGVVAAVIGLAGLFGANPAEAQTQCTYPFNNCPTTTTSRHAQPVILLDLSVAAPGQTVQVIVCGYAPGTVVKITINGAVVATFVVGNVPPNACAGKGGVALARRGGGGDGVAAMVGPIGRLLDGRVAAQTQPVSGAQSQFTVPSNLTQGQYLVCAEVVGIQSTCTNLNVANAQGGPLSSNNGSATLAFTGAGLIRLLALAFCLMAVGVILMLDDAGYVRAR